MQLSKQFERTLLPVAEELVRYRQLHPDHSNGDLKTGIETIGRLYTYTVAEAALRDIDEVRRHLTTIAAVCLDQLQYLDMAGRTLSHTIPLPVFQPQYD